MRIVLRRSATKRTLALTVLLVSAAMACGLVPGRSSGGLEVVASTTILADMVRNVAGGRATVSALVPAGAEVEEYSPKPEDAQRVTEAAAIIINGLDLEAWAEALLRNKKADAVVVTLTEGLPDLDGNPHMWFDAQLARRYVENIRDALTRADPAGEDVYRRGAAAYDAKLVTLDAELRARAAEVPAARRKLVTSHDAFPYFAKAYGFEIVGFVQSEAGKEPSPAELAELVDKVKAAGVSAIFVESQASPKLSQTLASEAAIKNIVSDLPTDSLQDPPADTYIGLLRTVMDEIVAALK